MAVNMKATTVVWDVTWCGLPEIYQHLRQSTGAAKIMKYFYQILGKWTRCPPFFSCIYLHF